MTAKPIRLADVAKAAGVSHGTASNVFSRPDIVREEVREKVLAAAHKLGYSGPNPIGRMLRAGKVNATGAGISLVSAANNEQLAWNIQSALVDGFIVFCIEGGSRLVELTRERKLPFVALDFGFDDASIASIGVDDVAGARLAARHLADLGHRDFGILSMQFNEEGFGPASIDRAATAVYSGTRDRLQGYMEELSGFGVDTAQIPIYETENDRATTWSGLDYLFSGARRPTAILAMSDRMALYALDWFAERGISVPDDVSIIGFDGVPEGEISKPALTTIAQPMAEMGRRAVDMILSFDGAVRRETLDVELVVRGSTSAPSRSD